MLAMAAGGLILSWQGVLVDRLSAHMQSSDAAYLGLFAAGLGRLASAVPFTGDRCRIRRLADRRRRDRPATVAATVALAGMAGVSLWIGIIRPELAARRTFRTFAIQMRTAIGDAADLHPGRSGLRDFLLLWRANPAAGPRCHRPVQTQARAMC